MIIPLEIIAAGRTDTGRVRECNEDAYALDHARHLYLVADGMGGHQAGDVASRLLVEELPRHFTPPFDDDVGAVLKRAVAAANAALFETARAQENRRGMGSTLVALYATPQQATLAHVGDSRAYLIRGERISQLTEDHSLVNAQLHAGLLTPEQAAASPNRNVITRAVGTHRQVEADVTTFTPEPMDRVLLCTDGLSNLVEPAQIWEIVTRAVTLGIGVRRLIEAANRAGGNDNITAVLVQFVPRPRRFLHKLYWFFSRQVAQ
ncbi:Stp1/IreP family PP2C-type Ser/Thr phosphatase [bacterium]|nr:Stp1/IreP family PP2C-type Ser/Thr phosphatase [bacterium]